MVSFELSPVIVMGFVADLEHVSVCWGRDRTTIESLKNLTRQTNPFSKSTTETLKQDVKSVRS